MRGEQAVKIPKDLNPPPTVLLAVLNGEIGSSDLQCVTSSWLSSD